MTSDLTKQYKKKALLFRGISIISMLIPCAYFVTVGFINGEPHEKIGLGISMLVAIILTLTNIVLKTSLRSRLWIILLGVSFCLDSFRTLIWMMCISTLLDEIVLTPAANYYKNKTLISKEIDKRSE